MKTISEIAKQIGVSKSAIHKKLRVEPLKTLLQNNISTIGNKILLDENAENILKSTFSGKTPTDIEEIEENENQVDDIVHEIHNKTNPVDEISANFISSLQNQVTNLTTQIEKLQEELSKEREHSREQADRIIQLAEQGQKLAENAQTLHAMENVKPQLSNEKKRGLFKFFFKK